MSNYWFWFDSDLIIVYDDYLKGLGLDCGLIKALNELWLKTVMIQKWPHVREI